MEKICFKTAKGPAAVGPYSTAVIYGDTIYMSGMIGVDPAVQKPVEGGTLAQAKQVFENIKTILSEIGLSMDDVLKTTVFLTNLGDFAEVNYDNAITRDNLLSMLYPLFDTTIYTQTKKPLSELKGFLRCVRDSNP